MSRERHVLNQQPAQLLIIDFSKSFSKNVLNLLVEYLQHIMPLVCALPGPSRVPIFSVIIANLSDDKTHEVLVGFERTRSNFTTMHEAIRRLEQRIDTISYTHSSNGLLKSLNIGLSNYRTISQKPGYEHDLEVTIVSGQLGYKIRNTVLKSMKFTSVTTCKLVTIVTISADSKISIDEIWLTDEDEDNSEDCDDDFVSIQYIMIAGFTELKKLRDHFMGWLLDRNKDSYHVSISLPHPYNDHKSMSLKFDIMELMLPIATLQIYNKASLEPSAAFVKPPSLVTRSDTAMKYTLPVHELKVLRQIPVTAGVLPYIYGMPLVIEATQCWRIDWDDLETNKRDITALHSELLKKNKLLICQSDAASEDVKPFAYYCLLPTPQCLLIHNVAFNELIMYTGNLEVRREISVPYQALIDMDMSLSKVKATDGYDLVSVESGDNSSDLVKAIACSLLPKRYTSRKRALDRTNKQTGEQTNKRRVDSSSCPPRNRRRESLPIMLKQSEQERITPLRLVPPRKQQTPNVSLQEDTGPSKKKLVITNFTSQPHSNDTPPAAANEVPNVSDIHRPAGEDRSDIEDYHFRTFEDFMGEGNTITNSTNRRVQFNQPGGLNDTSKSQPFMFKRALLKPPVPSSYVTPQTGNNRSPAAFEERDGILSAAWCVEGDDC